MGASKKWFRAVLGLEKSRLESDEDSSRSNDEIRHQQEDSDEDAGNVFEMEFDPNVVANFEFPKDASFWAVNHSDENDGSILENKSKPSVITEVKDDEDTSFLPMSMKCSGEIGSTIFANESDPISITDIEYAKAAPSISNPASWFSVTLIQDASWPSTSLQEQKAAQHQQKEREERAAIHIQAAFRRFLARRALCAMRGLVRLQSLVTSRSVRKQAAITLHSLQDLVRVRARVRARHVRMGLENQIAQQKLQQQLEQQEDHVKENIKESVEEAEVGWCDTVGSAEDIKAKSQKRKEAAAKREKAMAYALARQWQASSRQRLRSASAGQDKIYWSWNWWDSWMVSSQWENRTVDINLEDDPASAQHRPTAGKKPATNAGNKKMGFSSDVKSDISYEEKARSSPHKLALKEISSPCMPTRSPRTVVKDSGRESPSRLFPGPRSRSTPKERSPRTDNKGKKRLSLPDSALTQTSKQPSRHAVRRSRSAPKPMKTRTKSISDDVQASSLSLQKFR